MDRRESKGETGGSEPAGESQHPETQTLDDELRKLKFEREELKNELQRQDDKIRQSQALSKPRVVSKKPSGSFKVWHLTLAALIALLLGAMLRMRLFAFTKEGDL